MACCSRQESWVRYAVPMNDLIILVADKNMEQGIRAVVERHQSLGIRRITYDLYPHPHHDSGCYLKSHDFLRPFQNQNEKALVVFDREGCGRDDREGNVLADEVQKRLSRSGWGDRCAVIVIDPELEAWVWSDSPQVEEVLGWRGRSPALRVWLEEKGYKSPDEPKPSRPKEALEEALRVVGKPRSSAIYRQLGEQVGLARCTDPAFVMLKGVLRTWFPS